MPIVQSQRDMDAATRAFYCDALSVLNAAGVPFLVGGAYAFARYTGIERHTRDLDVFVWPEDCERVLDAFAQRGYQTELTFSHWLGKVRLDDTYVDVIFSSGNGVATVDDGWFEHAREGTILDVPVRTCPPEEMVWSKSYVMERERFDGADIQHLLLAGGADFDWQRLLHRFGADWRVLLAHLVLFDYVYPFARAAIPTWVRDELARRLSEEAAPARGKQTCYGTMLSREQYLVDIQEGGLADARTAPGGPMTPQEVVAWTRAIAEK